MIGFSLLIYVKEITSLLPITEDTNNVINQLNMTKYIGLFVVIVAVASCKQKASTTSKLTKSVECSDPINIIIQQHAAVWCTEDMTSAHEITEAAYELYLSNRWSTIPPTNNITWGDIQALIGTNTCYEKYVTFTFEQDAKDNSSIKADLTECFDATKSCYSIPLLQHVAKDNALTNSDVFECSIAKVDSLPDSVIFAVLDRTKKIVSKRYYDVSTYPKLITKRLNAME